MIKNLVYLGLVVLGFVQMLGFVARQPALRGAGTLTVASPLPLVFTTINGLETYSSTFYFEYQDDSGTWQRVKITPEIYSQLKGPYQYRNVLGAAISYGPRLPETLWQPILHHAFVDPGQALAILELKKPPVKCRIHLELKHPSTPNSYDLEIP